VSGGRWRLWLTLALTVASLLLFFLFERFEPVGEPWLRPAAVTLADGWDVQADGTGEVSLGSEGARLRADRPQDGPLLRRRFVLPPGTEFVRVRAELAVEAVRRGPLPWQGVRIVLVQLDDQGRHQWDLPHLADVANGSQHGRSVTQEFWISRAARALELRAELRQATGEFLVRELWLEPVQEVEAFGTVRHMLFLCWVSLWLWLVVPLMATAPRRLRHVLAMLVAMTILAGTLTPHSARQSAKQLLIELERTVIGERDAGPEAVPGKPVAPAEVVAGAWPVAQKAMHFLLFVVLALAALWARPDDPWLALVGYLALFAAICEVLQLFALDRTPLLSEAGINLAGVAVGTGCMAWLRRRRLA